MRHQPTMGFSAEIEMENEKRVCVNCWATPEAGRCKCWPDAPVLRGSMEDAVKCAAAEDGKRVEVKQYPRNKITWVSSEEFEAAVKREAARQEDYGITDIDSPLDTVDYESRNVLRKRVWDAIKDFQESRQPAEITTVEGRVLPDDAIVDTAAGVNRCLSGRSRHEYTVAELKQAAGVKDGKKAGGS